MQNLRLKNLTLYHILFLFERLGKPTLSFIFNSLDIFRVQGI